MPLETVFSIKLDNPKNPEGEKIELFGDEQALKAFRAFLETELSTENIDFLKRVQVLHKQAKSNPDVPSVKLNDLQTLYDMYVGPDAREQVNLSSAGQRPLDNQFKRTAPEAEPVVDKSWNTFGENKNKNKKESKPLEQRFGENEKVSLKELKSLLDTAGDNIRVLVERDAWPRFLKSPEYTQYVQLTNMDMKEIFNQGVVFNGVNIFSREDEQDTVKRDAIDKAFDAVATEASENDSLNDISFLIDVHSLHLELEKEKGNQEPDPEFQKKHDEKLREIYENYIKLGAPYKVEISTSVAAKIQEAYDKPQPNSPPSLELFARATNERMISMRENTVPKAEAKQEAELIAQKTAAKLEKWTGMSASERETQQKIQQEIQQSLQKAAASKTHHKKHADPELEAAMKQQATQEVEDVTLFTSAKARQLTGIDTPTTPTKKDATVPRSRRESISIALSRVGTFIKELLSKQETASDTTATAAPSTPESNGDTPVEEHSTELSKQFQAVAALYTSAKKIDAPASGDPPPITPHMDLKEAQAQKSEAQHKPPLTRRSPEDTHQESTSPTVGAELEDSELPKEARARRGSAELEPVKEVREEPPRRPRSESSPRS